MYPQSTIEAPKLCACGCGHRIASDRTFFKGHRPPKSFADRFWEHVDKTDTCWLWTGTLRPDGYAYIQLSYPSVKKVRVHRISYEMHYGPIPDGLLVCHKCDQRNCVRPEHLFLGTDKDNSDDMRAKGRQRYVGQPGGESNTSHKLSASDVIEIRKLYDEGVLTIQEIATHYGVSRALVSSIHKRWQCIADATPKSKRSPNYVAITDDQVSEIRTLSSQGISYTEIARRYSASRTNISKIVTRRTRKDIP